MNVQHNPQNAKRVSITRVVIETLFAFFASK